MRLLLRGWRRLTSMRTALVLLFLLAVAAVPGSLLPQRPLNPGKVDDYIAAHGSWGAFLDDIGMFDVFGAPWFAAIYLLLFVSLIGCLIPRIRVHAKAMARDPLPAPRVLSRLPESASFTTSQSPGDYAGAARQVLGRRWRVKERSEPTGAVTLSAEKGYSRETGNLLFHVALLASLILIAVGRLYSYQGTKIVIQGNGFCNTIAQYDSWKPGRLASQGVIEPGRFCIDDLRKFTATYTASGEPSEFRADIVYRPRLGEAQRAASITVNHPLRIDGDRVYLIGHGFAPEITVRMPNGDVVHDTAQFAPSDATTFLSQGVFKEPGPGTGNDVGIRAVFAPTPAFNGTIVTSTSPRVQNPVLGIVAFRGNLNTNGLAQSIYDLDTSKMRQIGMRNLTTGQTVRCAGGVSVTFDGWKPWASLQVSHDPAQGWLVWSAAAMVLGLLGSLGVRRRRVWLRMTPGVAEDGRSPTVVTVGGLARSDSGNFTTEFVALVERLRTATTPNGDDRIATGVASGTGTGGG